MQAYRGGGVAQCKYTACITEAVIAKAHAEAVVGWKRCPACFAAPCVMCAVLAVGRGTSCNALQAACSRDRAASLVLQPLAHSLRHHFENVALPSSSPPPPPMRMTHHHLPPPPPPPPSPLTTTPHHHHPPPPPPLLAPTNTTSLTHTHRTTSLQNRRRRCAVRTSGPLTNCRQQQLWPPTRGTLIAAAPAQRPHPRSIKCCLGLFTH